MILSHYQLLVKRTLKQWGVKTEVRMLEDIDDIYYEQRRENFLKVWLYRWVNVVFGIIALFLYWTTYGTQFEKFFWLWSTIAFVLYNAAYAIFGSIKWVKLRLNNEKLKIEE